MRAYRYIILTLVVLLYSILPSAAQSNRGDFVIENDSILLRLDLKLKKAEIDSLLKMADIKGITYDNLLHNQFSTLVKEGWQVKQSGKNVIVLLKPVAALAQASAYLALSLPKFQVKGTEPGVPVDVLYGINKFYRQSVHDLPGGLTRFFLRGNLNAKRVLLSGSFNGWNTSKGLMLRTDSGWISDIKLEPGQHLYKFIVNGNWMHDADNQLKVPDGYGDFNSIYYRYNYTFRLSGYPNAARVMLAGSFNNFNGTEIVMQKRGAVWQMPLYLKETVHTYRFLVDGKWVPDAANPKFIADGKGNINSVLQMGPVYSFKLQGFANARNVFVAGDFNNWKPDELRMKRVGNLWQVDVPLTAGNFGYKFIVDGRWMTDPANPCVFSPDGNINSLLVVRPTHTFTLKGFDKAKSIRLAGTFNDWNPEGYTMAHHDNEWTISLNLKPGKYLYKFLVDGNWIIDPANKLWEQNQYDTGNSVLWLE